MPLISQFYGILIRMFFKDSESHHIPHFHAVYGEFSATYTLDGEIIIGSLPNKQNKLVAAWAVLHYDELCALWKLTQEEGSYFTIKGLE
ncbi:MAG: DUF4160 domain-containing protein [bacterium]